MKTFHLVISSPGGKIFDEDISALSLRGSDGDLAILAGHTPFVTSVVPCRLSITYPDGMQKKASIDSGLLSVSNTGVTLTSLNVNFEIE